jgi:hypothetical protein
MKQKFHPALYITHQTNHPYKQEVKVKCRKLIKSTCLRHQLNSKPMQPQHQGMGESVTRATATMHGILIELRWPPCSTTFLVHLAAAKNRIV